MKQFLIENIEKEHILNMHEKLKKQKFVFESNENKIEEQSSPVQDSKNEEDTLRKAIAANCIRGGALKRRKSTGRVFYRVPTKSDPNKFVDFFGDMSYAFVDGSKKGKWKCDALVTKTVAPTPTDLENKAKIDSYREQGWKPMNEFIGVDINTIDKTHDMIQVGDVKLYRPKGASTTFVAGTGTADFNKEQQDFVDKFVKLGYKLNPTKIEQQNLKPKSEVDLGAPADLFPNGLTMWYDPNTQKNVSRKDTLLGDILDNQSVDRQACRKNVEDFYKAFKRKVFVDKSTLDQARSVVQACKNEHYGKWGVLGGGKKLDNYLDILSGNVSGGPSSYGDDAGFRLS